MHVFDRKNNPIVEELLRLAEPHVRRLYGAKGIHVVASGLAAQLYPLKSFDVFRGYWRINDGSRIHVAVGVLVDGSSRMPFHFPYFAGDGDRLILLAIRRASVVEIFNGKVSDRAEIRKIIRAIVQSEVPPGEVNADENRIPHKSDEEIRREFGPGGSDGAPPNGDPPDGDPPSGNPGQGDGEGGNGRGGLREVIGHPVLFSVDLETYNSILEQT